MIMKMLTHLHMLVHTGFDAFEKMKYIFSIALVECLEKSPDCFSLKNTHRTLWPQAPDAEPMRPVCCQSLVKLTGSIGRSALDADQTLFVRPMKVESAIKLRVFLTESTGRLGESPVVASGDPARLTTSLRTCPLCTGHVRCLLDRVR